METLPVVQHTRDGRLVNAHSGLCASHSNELAQTTVFWTDDAEFPDGDGWTNERRFTQIQHRATDTRARCLTECGRNDESPAQPEG